MTSLQHLHCTGFWIWMVFVTNLQFQYYEYNCGMRTDRLHYSHWRNLLSTYLLREQIGFIVTIIVLRLRNFHLLMTFCLDSEETCTSKGPFGQVLSGYLQFNYLCYDFTAFLFVCVRLFLECSLPVCFTVLCFMYVYDVYFSCILFLCCLTWRNIEWLSWPQTISGCVDKTELFLKLFGRTSETPCPWFSVNFWWLFPL